MRATERAQENRQLTFGSVMGESITGNTRRFTSYDRSTTTKLDYAVNRFYHAGLGRFTQVDPIGMGAASPGDPQSLNLYAYCHNDPINHTDPDGLDPTGGLITFVVVSIISAIFGAIRTGNSGSRARTAPIVKKVNYRSTAQISNRAIWTRAGIQAGVGAVSAFIGDNDGYRTDENGDLVFVIETWDWLRGLEHLSNFVSGFGDSLTFGGTQWLRKKLNADKVVNPCSKLYTAGVYVALGVGYFRLAYAGAAKALPAIYRGAPTLARALTISGLRNSLKTAFRGGLFRNFRRKSVEEVIDRYNGDPKAIIEASTRSNTAINAGGALTFGGAVKTALGIPICPP